MGNIVTNLFDNIITALPDPSASDLEPFNTPQNEGDHDLDDNLFDSEVLDIKGDLFPIDDYIDGITAVDRMNGGRVLIDTEEKDDIEGGIRSLGFDVLAFYKSYRNLLDPPFKGTWGIFYFRFGIDFIAEKINESYPGYSDPRQLALGFLREHEKVHFEADVQTLLFESSLQKSLYIPLRKKLRGIHHEFVEEALANKAEVPFIFRPPRVT